MINDEVIYNTQEKALLTTNSCNKASTQSSLLTRDELESAKILQHFSLTFINSTIPSVPSFSTANALASTIAVNATVREGGDKKEQQDDKEVIKGFEQASTISISSQNQEKLNELSSKTNDVSVYDASSKTMGSLSSSLHANTLSSATIGTTATLDGADDNAKKRQRDCDSDPESDDENDDDEDDDEDGENGNKKGNGKKRVRHPVYPLWTVEEDELLMQKNIECGNDWAKISTFLTGRSRVDVKVRYKSIVSAEKKLWNIKDDERIFQLHKIHNADWKTISSHFHGRTKNAVRVRYKELKRLAFQPIKAPSLGSAKQIFYKRCHPHFHRNSTVIGSSDSSNQEDVLQKSMPAPQMEKSKKETTAANNKASSSSSIFNDDTKKDTEVKNTATSSLFDTSIAIDDSMKISPQITQKEVNSRILTSIVHSSPQVRFPGARPTIFCAPTPGTMNIPMHYQTMMNCFPAPGWPTQPTLTAIPTMFQQMPPNTANSIPLMYSMFPQMTQFQQAPSKGI